VIFGEAEKIDGKEVVRMIDEEGGGVESR